MGMTDIVVIGGEVVTVVIWLASYYFFKNN